MKNDNETLMIGLVIAVGGFLIYRSKSTPATTTATALAKNTPSLMLPASTTNTASTAGGLASLANTLKNILSPGNKTPTPATQLMAVSEGVMPGYDQISTPQTLQAPNLLQNLSTSLSLPGNTPDLFAANNQGDDSSAGPGNSDIMSFINNQDWASLDTFNA